MKKNVDQVWSGDLVCRSAGNRKRKSLGNSKANIPKCQSNGLAPRFEVGLTGSNSGGSDINGKLDEGAASLILDTKPSKVVSDERTVLVHGSAEATEHLKQHCLKHVCPHVYAPQIEETIDVTSDLCAYKVQ
ncbi:hypothetical protein JHK82_031654 [Glycine max]|nr:hypothetical protein JHK85_032311 [Glycine max]KAG5124917.1 hypothetical protein JHK82_031654 [Glycine max]